MIFPKLIIDAMLQDNAKRSVFFALTMGGCLLVGSVLTDFLEKFNEKKIVVNKERMVLLLQEKLLKTGYSNLENPAYMDSYQKAFSVYSMWQADLGRGMDAVLQFAAGILSLIVAAYILFTLNWGIAVIVGAIVILSSLCNTWAVKRMSELLMSFAPNVRKVGYFFGELQERKYAKEIRVYHLQEWIGGHANRLLQSMLNGTMKAMNRQISAESISITAGALQECGSYLYIGWLALKRRITLGDVSMYVSAVNTFADSMKSVMGQYLILKEMETYYRDFWIFLYGDNADNRAGEKQLTDIPEQISFELDHVWFCYPGKEDWILKDVCMQVRAGEKISLVGDNGAGKTTLVKLLMGLYEPTSGRVLINGRNLAEYDKATYWKRVGVVFQDYKTLAFTIRENITLSKGMGDTVKLEAALRESGLWDKVQSLEDKEETYLGKSYHENGTEFSGGEQQKLAMAQVLYKDAPVMILDEPTANLSPMEEYRIFHQFYDMSEGKTVVFISHRMSSCRLCDKIIVLHKGEVYEQGSHEELMKENGMYADMFRAQAQYYV